MNIQELISLVPICSKYNKELIISLLGGDEATSEKIVATNIPPYDKVYILFNLAFLTAEQIKWLSLEFAKHACKYQFDENNVGNLSNYKTGTYEYNAILASDGFDFETGLKLVKKRGELMGNVDSGSMAAVIGISQNEIKDIIESMQLNSIDIANINSKNQTVISALAGRTIKDQNNNFFNTPDDSISCFWNGSPSFVK